MAENKGNSGNSGNGENEKGSYAFGKLAQIEEGAKAVNKAASKSAEKNMKKSEKLGSKSFDQSQKAFDLSKKGDAKGAAKSSKKAGKSMAKARKKSEKAQKALKVAKKAEKVAKFAAKLGAIITAVIVALIVIIALIGLLVFITTGFGFIMSGLQNVITSFGEGMHAAWYGDAEELVKEESILDLGSYIEELGYDLYDYGFVTAKNAITTVNDDVEEKVKRKYNRTHDNVYETELQKAEDGDEAAQTRLNNIREITKKENKDLYGDADGDDYYMNFSYEQWKSEPDNPYRYLREYLVSDNYGTLIKNHNINLLETYGIYYLENLGFGSGMIELFYDRSSGGVISGKKGLALSYKNEFFTGLDVSVKDGKLSIKTNKLFDEDLRLEYDLDGWIGRYGMPMEFLLALHLSTMSPDLAYKMATNFDTTVEVLLYKIENAEVDAAIEINDKLVLKDDVAYVKDGFINNSITDSEIYDLFKKGILSPYKGGNDSIDDSYKCVGPGTWSQTSAQENGEYEYADNSTIDSVSFEDMSKIVVDGIKEYTDSQNITLNSGEEEKLKAKVEENLQKWFDEIVDKLKEASEDAEEIENKDYHKDDKNVFGWIKGEWDKLNEEGSVTKQSVETAIQALNGGGNYQVEGKDQAGNVYAVEATVSVGLKLDANGVINYGFNFRHKAISTKNGDVIYCDDVTNSKNPKICDGCKAYAKTIIEALYEVHVDGARTYSPYLYRVKDHWFRDVYFTSEAIGSGEQIVKTDTDYEKKTGERWTLYETYETGDRAGDYKLYVYKFNEETNSYDNILSDILCQKVQNGKGDYELKDDGTTYVYAKGSKKAEYILVDAADEKTRYSQTLSQFRVGKKAIYEDTEDTKSKLENSYVLRSKFSRLEGAWRGKL